MACRMMARSHYLNQCWFIIEGVLWYSHESNFHGNTHGINLQDEFENCISKISAASLRGQRVKHIYESSCFCGATTGTILCMCPANERWRYSVTPSLIGWAHTQNGLMTWVEYICYTSSHIEQSLVVLVFAYMMKNNDKYMWARNVGLAFVLRTWKNVWANKVLF